VLSAIANGQNVSNDARSALQLLAAGYLVTGRQITLDVGAHDGVLTIENIPVRPLAPVY
jgi:curli biogenesis system outer membrane secretion channel CsgG